MSPTTLELILKRAASEADWSHVVHRCAWCKRVANALGDYADGEVDDAHIATDGMCPTCAARALASLATRRRVAV